MTDQEKFPAEVPASVWHNVSEELPTPGSNILMIRKEEEDINYPPIAGCFHGTNSRLDGRNWGYYNGFCYNEIEPPVKWAYIDDILNLSNIERTGKDWKKEPVSEELEEAAHEYADLRMSSYETAFYAFMSGAEWADSHPNLTWEDISKIISITEQLKTSWWFRDNEQTKKIGTQVFWEEVLKRFKNFKERKEK